MALFTAHNNSKALHMLIIKPIALAESDALQLVIDLLTPYMQDHYFSLVKLKNNSWRFRIDADEFISVNTGLPIALIFHTKEFNNRQFDEVVWFGTINLSEFNDKKWEIKYVASAMRGNIRKDNCRIALFHRPKVGEEQLRLTSKGRTTVHQATQGNIQARKRLMEIFDDPHLFPQPNSLVEALTDDPTLTFNYRAEAW